MTQTPENPTDRIDRLEAALGRFALLTKLGRSQTITTAIGSAILKTSCDGCDGCDGLFQSTLWGKNNGKLEDFLVMKILIAGIIPQVR